MLGEEPVRIAQGEQALEERQGLVAPAQGREGIDQPERADDERVLGRAEVVLLDVAEDEIAALEVALDRGDGLGEAWVLRVDEVQLVEKQQARVELIAPERGHEALLLVVPCTLADG